MSENFSVTSSKSASVKSISGIFVACNVKSALVNSHVSPAPTSASTNLPALGPAGSRFPPDVSK